MTRFVKVLVAAALVACMAPAQDAAEPALTGVMLFIAGGGTIGYIILLCSVIGLALAIEAGITITRKKLAPPEVVDQLRSHIENKDYQAGYDLCEQNPCYVTNVMHAALQKVDHGFEKMEEAAGAVAEEEAVRLHSKISWMGLIGTVAPLLGLFGTVQGMIVAFETIEKMAAPKPSELAIGIKIALVTTFQGLMVAIPVTVAFFVFRNKVVGIVLDMGAVLEDLLEPFRPAPGRS
jgi:biopolymer transport protein ExbB